MALAQLGSLASPLLILLLCPATFFETLQIPVVFHCPEFYSTSCYPVLLFYLYHFFVFLKNKTGKQTNKIRKLKHDPIFDLL